MSKSMTLKMPDPLAERIDALMKKEDKDNRNALLCELLDMAVRIREANKKHSPNDRLEELIEICTSKILLQVNRAVGEIVRFTYDPKKSHYSECNSADSLIQLIAEKAQLTVSEYKGELSEGAM